MGKREAGSPLSGIPGPWGHDLSQKQRPNTTEPPMHAKHVRYFQGNLREPDKVAGAKEGTEGRLEIRLERT